MKIHINPFSLKTQSVLECMHLCLSRVKIWIKNSFAATLSLEHGYSNFQNGPKELVFPSVSPSIVFWWIGWKDISIEWTNDERNIFTTQPMIENNFIKFSIYDIKLKSTRFII